MINNKKNSSFGFFFHILKVGGVMNIKKLFQALFVFALLFFSFYYTEKSIELVREVDPIMKQIKTTSDKYEIEAIDAKVTGNLMIPGISGRQIDYEKSYSKMKQYGNYNEALTVFMETTPTVSIDDYYDKYIVSGNKEKKSVALVFTVKEEKELLKIVSILNMKNVAATFFIDGLYMENNLSTVEKLQDYELELLSYDNKYEEVYFTSAVDYLNNLTKREAKYCYAEYDNKNIIELCSKLKLHTIIPTITVKDSVYREVKEKLMNAAIIAFPVSKKVSDELGTIIDYISQKGYTFQTLEELLNEFQDK